MGREMCCYERPKVFGEKWLGHGISPSRNTVAILAADVRPCTSAIEAYVLQALANFIVAGNRCKLVNCDSVANIIYKNSMLEPACTIRRVVANFIIRSLEAVQMQR